MLDWILLWGRMGAEGVIESWRGDNLLGWATPWFWENARLSRLRAAEEVVVLYVIGLWGDYMNLWPRSAKSGERRH